VTSDGQSLKEWRDRIRETLSGLGFSQIEAEDYGEDNFVFVLDRTWIVRAPKTEEYRWRFAAELNLLAALRPLTPVPVPHYEHIAADKGMGAYRMIDGAELTPPVFALLDTASQDFVLIQLAAFLSALHALPEETIRQPDGMIQRRWSGEQYAARYRGMRRAKIARVAPPAMLARFDDFHEALCEEKRYVPALTHDDLTEDHILVRADGSLAGVIDFSDAGWGDPASDFAWFWRLGEARVDLVLSNYARAVLDPGLKARSRWDYVRFLINQIGHGDRAKWCLPPAAAMLELDEHLHRLGL
jgi:aminoglycoside 2''-phosphotransferase